MLVHTKLWSWLHHLRKSKLKSGSLAEKTADPIDELIYSTDMQALCKDLSKVC